MLRLQDPRLTTRTPLLLFSQFAYVHCGAYHPPVHWAGRGRRHLYLSCDNLRVHSGGQIDTRLFP